MASTTTTRATGISTTTITATTINTTITTTATTSTEALYRLLAWLSPAYPVGAYSYSHGLEMAVEDGAVRDRADLVAYVTVALRDGAGRVDGALLAAAHALCAHPAFRAALWRHHRYRAPQGRPEDLSTRIHPADQMLRCSGLRNLSAMTCSSMNFSSGVQ